MTDKAAAKERMTALLREGITQGAAGDLVGARIALSSVLELDPRHYDAWYNLGNVHREERAFARAAACYRTALAIEPDNHPVLYQLAVVLEADGRAAEARAAYRDAVRTSPNAGQQWGYRGMDFTQKAEAALRRLGPAG